VNKKLNCVYSQGTYR